MIATQPFGSLDPASPPDRLIDVKEAAAMCKCSWRHFLRMADIGLAPSGIKFGRLRRFKMSEIQAWLAAGCPPIRRPESK